MKVRGHEMEIHERSSKYLVYFYLEPGEGWLKMEVRKGTLLEKALFSGRQDILYRLLRFAQTKNRRYLNEAIKMVKVEGGIGA